jgi:hypothetical protein
MAADVLHNIDPQDVDGLRVMRAAAVAIGRRETYSVKLLEAV